MCYVFLTANNHFLWYFSPSPSLYKELFSIGILLKEKEASKNALSYKCQDKEREIYSLRSDLDRSANEIEDLKIKLTGGEAEIKVCNGKNIPLI